MGEREVACRSRPGAFAVSRALESVDCFPETNDMLVTPAMAACLSGPPVRRGRSSGWNIEGTHAMSKHVYKKVELVGSSPDGVEDAINSAIARCGESVRNLRWFEVTQVRGEIANGKIAHYQVTMKVGFTLDE
jgi:dodecin